MLSPLQERSSLRPGEEDEKRLLKGEARAVELCNGKNCAWSEVSGYVLENKQHIARIWPDVKDNKGRLSLQHSLASWATQEKLRQETLRLPRRTARERCGGALN